MWVLGAMVEAAGALFITSRPPASTAYSLTHFLPLSQKAFAGAAALEVALHKRRKETGLQSAAYNRPTPFLPQWARIHVFCRIPLNPVPTHQPATHIPFQPFSLSSHLSKQRLVAAASWC